MNGYHERLLRLNLTKKSFKVEKIRDDIIRKYIGAKGLGAYYLYKELKPRINPLSVKNKIILSSGPFQSTNISSAGRCALLTKSPLTGIFLDSYFGGNFGHVLKLTGYDMIIIEGKFDSPGYVTVTPETVEFKDARSLWGKITRETENSLHESEGKKCEVLSIGPAGENLVKVASPVTSYRRVAGRGGSGAVFGSKKLKAIVIKGSNKTVHANRDEFTKKISETIKKLNADRETNPFYKYGTSGVLSYANKTDRLPTRNYQSCQFEHYEKITGETFHKDVPFVGKPCCTPCVIACQGELEVQSSKFNEARGRDRPEYETLAMTGSNLGINNLKDIMELNDLCNEYGVDTISTGGILGFAMELTVRNIYDFKVRFGEVEPAKSLLRKIVYREDEGNILAEGVRKAAELIGQDAYKFAVHCKGLEVPAWDPRGKLGSGLAYATADIGASHLRDWLKTRKVPNVSALEIVEQLVKSQNANVVRDSYIICTFAWEGVITFNDYLQLYNYITGFDETEESIINKAANIWSLIRQFNINEGISRKDDTLSWRHLNDALPTGPAKDCTAFVSLEDLQLCLDKYYELRGWNADGKPVQLKIEN